jgi:two-component system cell cycle response regulator
MQDDLDCVAGSGELEEDRPTVPGAEPAAPPPSAARCNTPVIPSRPEPVGVSRATLTLLTGVHAGRLVTIDAAELIIGRAVSANFVVEDPGVSERHARVAHTSDGGGFYVEDLGSTNGTFVGSERIGLSLLHGGEVVQLGPQLRMRFAMVDAVEESLHRQLYESSIHDPLTHVFNRRYVADRLVGEVARARRAKGDLAVLMADIDGLKQVNDTYGHFAGDRTLCIVAARMKRVLRDEDILARYGGDEFVIVAPTTGPGEIGHLAERLRRAIEELQMSAQGQHVRITLSIGAASLVEVSSSDHPVTTLIALADARLHGAKAAGRNRVSTANPASGAPPVADPTNLH